MLMRLTPDAAVQGILDRFPNDRPDERPVVIGFAGASAAGKSTLAGRLKAVLAKRGLSTVELNLDRYYRGRAERAMLGAKHFDDPVAIDHALAARDLAILLEGRAIEAPIYDFPKSERVGSTPLAPADVILVDGLFLLSCAALRELLDISLHFDIDADGGLWRRLFRDAGPAGRTKQLPREVLRQYFTEVLPAKRAHMDPYAELADIIVCAAYDPMTEAMRAGPLELQRKARGARSDIEIQQRLQAALLGTQRQRDLYLVPKGRTCPDEAIRLRFQGRDVYLTYKGPHVAAGLRHVSPMIKIGHEDVAWFEADYERFAEVMKHRTIFSAQGLIVSRDSVRHLGDFIHVSHLGDPSIGGMTAIQDAFAALGLGSDELISESYLDLRLRQMGR